jgi:hypothetical protein
LNASKASSIKEAFDNTLKTGMRMIPDWQRFSLLTKPYSLTMNAIVGPYGSAIMASLESALQGEEKGKNGLKLLLNPKNFPKKYVQSFKEAGQRIADAIRTKNF